MKVLHKSHRVDEGDFNEFEVRFKEVWLVMAGGNRYFAEIWIRQSKNDDGVFNRAANELHLSVWTADRWVKVLPGLDIGWIQLDASSQITETEIKKWIELAIMVRDGE